MLLNMGKSEQTGNTDPYNQTFYRNINLLLKNAKNSDKVGAVNYKLLEYLESQ